MVEDKDKMIEALSKLSKTLMRQNQVYRDQIKELNDILLVLTGSKE